jgi:ketosteroid isomerase-like protein
MDMMPQEIVRRYYASLAPGRRQDLMEFLDPQVVLDIQEGFPGARTRYVGHRAYVDDFLYSFYGSFDVELHAEEFLECGARVVAEGRMKGRAIATSIPVDVPFVHIWTVYSGRMVGARMFTDTAVLRDAVTGHPVSIITP